jgi:hypothetical protein
MGTIKKVRTSILCCLAAGAIVAAATGALAAGPAAAEQNYNCPSHGYCQNINGNNEAMDYNEGRDYEYPEGAPVCSTIWKYNGGSNYNAVAKGCTETGTAKACYSKITGHGQVTSRVGGGVLAGHQDNAHAC